MQAAERKSELLFTRQHDPNNQLIDYIELYAIMLPQKDVILKEELRVL